MNILEHLQKLKDHWVFVILRYGAENNPYYDANGIVKDVGDDCLLLHIPDIHEGSPERDRDDVAADLIISFAHIITVLHHSDCPLCSLESNIPN